MDIYPWLLILNMKLKHTYVTEEFTFIPTLVRTNCSSKWESQGSLPFQRLSCLVIHLLLFTWALFPSKQALGLWKKNQVQWTGTTSTNLLLAKRIVKVLKIKLYNVQFSLGKSLLSLTSEKVLSNNDALCLIACLSLQHSQVVYQLRKTIHYNARLKHRYLFSLSKTDSWAITCSKEGKAQSNVMGSR